MSWEQLQSILDENEQNLRDARKPPTVCPISGDALVTGPNGRLRCPFDGWEAR